MRKDKKKISVRKIIYRKMREPKQNKSKTKIVCLAVFGLAAILLMPGICSGVNETPFIPSAHDPEPQTTPLVYNESETAQDSVARPVKLTPQTATASGHTSGILHQ